MFLFTLFSGVLFLIPVFVTFGVYFGVEHQKILRCGLNCHSTGNETIDDPINLVRTSFCEKSYAITPPPGNYIFNPNQWGDPDDLGHLCINFTESGYDVPDKYAPGWSATWQYPMGDDEHPVHAFANADLNLSSVLPIQMSSVSRISLDVHWSYNPGNGLNTETDFDALADANVNANVALDLFLAADEQEALSPTESDYEVMLWLGRLGAATAPLGLEDGSRDTRQINGVSFDLYTGANQFGQEVMTWLASENVTEFSGDISPLLENLDTYSGPKSSDYLGYIAFGTETLYADQNATFYVPTLKIDVIPA